MFCNLNATDLFFLHQLRSEKTEVKYTDGVIGQTVVTTVWVNASSTGTACRIGTLVNICMGTHHNTL